MVGEVIGHINQQCWAINLWQQDRRAHSHVDRQNAAAHDNIAHKSRRCRSGGHDCWWELRLWCNGRRIHGEKMTWGRLGLGWRLTTRGSGEARELGGRAAAWLKGSRRTITDWVEQGWPTRSSLGNILKVGIVIDSRKVKVRVVDVVNNAVAVEGALDTGWVR